VPADPGPLPQRVGCQRDDVEPIAEQTIRERSGHFFVHRRDQSRHLVDVEHFAERDDPGASEVAMEQVTDQGTFAICCFVNQYRRQLDVRPA